MKRTLFAIPLLTLSLSPVSLSYEATDSSYDSSIPTRVSKVKGVTGTTLIDDGKLLHVPDNSAQDTTRKDPSPDCLVSEDDLIKNDEDPVSSTGTGLYANQSFHSETWGAIGHYYLIEISNITSVTGAYSHFGYFYEKNLLESGNLDVSFYRDSTYTVTSGHSVTYSFNVDSKVESAIGAKENVYDLNMNVDAHQKTGASYIYNYTYSRMNQSTERWSTNIELNKNTARYCPDGYSITVGMIGHFYLIHGTYQEYTNWWWGDYPSSGSELKTFDAIVCNEQTMTLGYVYLEGGDDDVKFNK